MNADGVDDLYAARYGVVGLDPVSDDDHDGFQLLDESLFETDPTDANDRPGITLVSGESLILRTPSKRGVEYNPEAGGDLEAWFPNGALKAGTGGIVEWGMGQGNNTTFFRIRARPMDRDGDGLRDIDEEDAGTDPLHSDTDGDGLGDGFEAADPALDPRVANNSCLDANGNGKADIEDFAATLGTRVVSWIAAGDGSWHTAANWSTGEIPGVGDVVLIAPCDANGPVVEVSSDAGAAAVMGNGSLVIDDAVFSLGSRMNLASLTLTDTAILKPLANAYARLSVALTGDLFLAATTAIDVAGAGYPVNEGPGAPAVHTGGGDGSTGGCHGGLGGLGRFYPAEKQGPAYGDLERPVEMGSGGSRGTGKGGGALRIIVGGTATIDGLIVADGTRNGASGSGGSVWMDCQIFSGTGSVRADGAAGGALSGAGGGGRVAIHYGVSTFAGELSARSGLNGNAGGAGSVYRKQSSAARGFLVYDNGGVSGAGTETPVVQDSLRFDTDIVVRSGARLSTPLEVPLTIDTSGNITVELDGAIDVTAKGHPPGEGPGVADQIGGAGSGACGGTHGGQGGAGRLIGDRLALGVAYGSFDEPVTMGSGSNRSSGGGGGALRLQAGGILKVEGVIAADGESDGGAGAGGSIWIECGTLAGAGVVRANGGVPGSNNGAGGGGRVAVYSDDTATFTGMIEARADDRDPFI